MNPTLNRVLATQFLTAFADNAVLVVIATMLVSWHLPRDTGKLQNGRMDN